MYETCGILSMAQIHFLIKAGHAMSQMHKEQNLGGIDDVTIVFPMLVTTANLHVIDSENLEVDLSTGLLDESSVEVSDVKWVLFDYPVSPMLPLKSSPLFMLPDHSKELATKMGCLIVQANSLIDFLNRFDANHLSQIARNFYDKK